MQVVSSSSVSTYASTPVLASMSANGNRMDRANSFSEVTMIVVFCAS